MEMRKIYLLPNLFTTASLFCGLLALIDIYSGDYVAACWFILAAIILDGLDGKIARLTNTESLFGINYDSLSDLVVFGVTPAMLMFSRLRFESFRLAAAVSIFFAICGALRLARYNVQCSKEEKTNFTGLPIPAAGGILVSIVLLFHNNYGSLLQRALLVVMVLISYLMVSKIPYPSLKNIEIEKRKPFDYLVAAIVIGCLIILLKPYKEALIFAGFVGYILLGVLLAAIQAFGRKEIEIIEHEVQEEADV
jgi:CDP-diacylglycerol--serine O-phosphatidyltransferase